MTYHKSNFFVYYGHQGLIKTESQRFCHHFPAISGSFTPIFHLFTPPILVLLWTQLIEMGINIIEWLQQLYNAILWASHERNMPRNVLNSKLILSVHHVIIIFFMKKTLNWKLSSWFPWANLHSQDSNFQILIALMEKARMGGGLAVRVLDEGTV